jgi:SH3-like domain-containing protein
LLLIAAGSACAADFKTVGATQAILYDAPSVKGAKLYVAAHGMPVDVVLTYGDWVKVRDISGELAPTQAKGLSAQRNVIVRGANTRLRSSAAESAPTIMLADKGVLLELVAAPDASWVKVRHRDGIAGFVKARDVWGI